MLSKLRFAMAFWAVLALVAACGGALDRETDTEPGDDDGPPDDGTGGGGGATTPQQCNQIDLVFVIDDSGSMGEEQDNLRANFPGFISVIDDYQTDSGEPLDYRIAVTTSGRDLHYTVATPEVCVPGIGCVDPPDVESRENGDNGEFKQKCDMSRRWIERGDANVTDTFSCAARVGTGGPSIEMPLYTTELALTERMNDGSNGGFLRENALLALVILSDEDDCSRTDNDFTVESDSCQPEWPENVPIDHFTETLDTIKGDRGRWAAAVIAGPGPGSCHSDDFGDALNARRLQQFVTATGTNAVFSSICQGDLTSALSDALETFSAACEAFPPVE